MDAIGDRYREPLMCRIRYDFLHRNRRKNRFICLSSFPPILLNRWILPAHSGVQRQRPLNDNRVRPYLPSLRIA